jgi:methionyl-tRNA formyltransferase
MDCSWWRRPRRVTIVVDNPSWILPYAENLATIIEENGDKPKLCRSYAEINSGEVAFFLGCTGIATNEVLDLNHYNLIVHESDLPKGRGFAPVAWQILDGVNEIPICLLEADRAADTGIVYYREVMCFKGHELNDQIRSRQGQMTIKLCVRFLKENNPPQGIQQVGQPTTYPRRYPKDSCINTLLSLEEQFDLLRVVDNQRYPAFFDYRGNRYYLNIEDGGKVPIAEK